MKVRLLKPSKTAMSSGRAKTKLWQLIPVADSPQTPDRLMGWQSGSDTRRQVVLSFDSKEQALRYAKKKGLEVDVTTPHDRSWKKKSYADNFTRPVVD